MLEIAGGTGISTVALRADLPQTTRIIATDLNPAMLDIAKDKLASAVNVEFQQADAQSLPFGDAAFDLITGQFGVMFFPDRPAAYAETRRVLRPGGTMLFNVWGEMSANPFAEIAHADAIRFFPDNPPKFYLTRSATPTPHACAPISTPAASATCSTRPCASSKRWAIGATSRGA